MWELTGEDPLERRIPLVGKQQNPVPHIILAILDQSDSTEDARKDFFELLVGPWGNRQPFQDSGKKSRMEFFLHHIELLVELIVSNGGEPR